MASPQIENGFVRIANELYNAILVRGFSKRQRAIVDLVMRLSYGCHKKTAYIPKLTQFVACGVDKYHIKSELLALRKSNVIDWHGAEYWVVKDYDSWLVPVPDDIQMQHLTELIKLNLHGYQIGNTGYQNGNSDEVESYQNGNQEVTKTVTKELPKRQLEEAQNPHGSKADRVSKDILKISKDKKKRAPTSATEVSLTPEQEQALTNLSEVLDITANDQAWIRSIGAKYPKVDLADVSWQLSRWFHENPYEFKKPKSNPRSRFRNWVANADKREQWRKPAAKVSQLARTPDEDEVDRRIREALSQ